MIGGATAKLWVKKFKIEKSFKYFCSLCNKNEFQSRTEKNK